jgi:hypothetical protein
MQVFKNAVIPATGGGAGAGGAGGGTGAVNYGRNDGPPPGGRGGGKALSSLWISHPLS